LHSLALTNVIVVPSKARAVAAAFLGDARACHRHELILFSAHTLHAQSLFARVEDLAEVCSRATHAAAAAAAAAAAG
jgi:hypothetical protein